MKIAQKTTTSLILEIQMLIQLTISPTCGGEPLTLLCCSGSLHVGEWPRTWQLYFAAVNDVPSGDGSLLRA